MITSTFPLTLAALVAGALFFAAALIWTRDGEATRAAYFFAAVFASLLVALVGLGGLARALGVAIADPKTAVPGCIERVEVTERFQRAGRSGGSGTLAQAPPEIEVPTAPPVPTFPPFEIPEPPPVQTVPPFEFPTPFPVPEPPDVQRIFECPESSARSAAAADAIGSGVLFASASGLVWASAVGARRLLEEDRHA